VNDKFLSLSPEAQNATVKQIATQVFPHLPANPQSSAQPPAADIAASPPRPVSTSPIDAARNAFGNVVSGVGQFGTAVDSAIARARLPDIVQKALGATGDLANGTDQAVINAGQAISGPNQYQPAPVHQLGADLMGGRPLSALNDAAGVVAGAVPYAATAMIPGAGSVLLGASGAGNTIASRELAKGTDSPSLGDVAAGVASGAINAIGGGVAHGLTPGMTPALLNILGPTLATRYAGRIAANAVAGGALGAGNAVLNTAGTGQLTPGGVANAAVEGAGTGGVAGVAGSVPGAVKAGLGVVGDNITSRAQGPITDEHAASIARIVPDLARFADPANNIRPNAPFTQKVAAYSKTLASQTMAMGHEIVAAPGMPAGVLSSVIRPLVSAASAHNNAVPLDLLAQFNALPINPTTRTTFNNAIADLDTLSQGKLLANQSGPFEAVGSKVGGLATTLALATHSPSEAVMNAVAGTAAENKLGGAVGGVVDRVLGTSKPVMMAQARMAAQQAKASGQPIGPSSIDATAAANTALQASNAANDTAAMAQRTRTLMGPTALALSTFGPDHPVGATAQAQLNANGVPDMATQAIQQFHANAAVMQAKADARNQALADAKDQADAQRRRRADAEAALAPVAAAQSKVDTLATQNQATLDASNLLPQTATPTGLTAVNAAVNQVGRQANGVRAMGGEALHPYAASPGVAGTLQGGLGAGDASVRASDATPSSVSPRTFQDHLIARGGDEHGVALSPADIQDAITQATAAGKLTPYDHAQVIANLDNKLNSGDMWNTANIVLGHAVQAKAAAGVPVRGVKAGGSGNGDSPVIYSPTRYANTVATNQGHLSDLAAHADATGDGELADLARALRVTKDVEARTTLRDNVVNSRLGDGDILGAARVKTLLPDSLISSGSPATGTH
jgi:hypothetical protein